MIRCSVEGCERPPRAKRGGLCALHYNRWLSTGDPGEAAPQRMRTNNKVCAVSNCTSPVRCKGLCSAHYTRARKMTTCLCGNPKVIGAELCRECRFKAIDATAVTEKPCTLCKQILPIETFKWRVTRQGDYRRRSRCTECENKVGRAHMQELRSTPEGKEKINAYKNQTWAEQPPEVKLLRSLRNSARMLNLDPNEVVRLWDAHGHTCDICGEPPNARRLYIDHDHKTGAFRGFLCSACNTGIGHLKDDPKLLLAAVAYLTG